MEKYVRNAALKMALNRLHYVQDVYSENLIDPDYAEKILDVYNARQLTTMYNAMQWALAHSDEDYTKLLHGTRHTNADILYYFQRLSEEVKKTGVVGP